MKKQPINPQPPIEKEALKIGKAKKYAAGKTAIYTAIQHALREMPANKAFGALNKMNQKKGFDCPGCAWPDPDGKRSALGEYCENGVKALAEEATTKRVDPAFFGNYTVGELSQYSDHWLGKQGRITHPMILRANSQYYRPISWKEAFETIATHLKALSTPDEAIFYTSGRTSNEAAFLYQLFVRQFGTNNLPDCSNMCHESSGVGLSETLGIGKGSVKLEDFYQTDLIIVMGQNPGTNHPRMLTALQEAKHNGAKIITINPLPEAGLMRFKNPQDLTGLFGQGTPLTDLFLQVQINGDVALLKAIMRCLQLAEEKEPRQVFDWKFIQEKTTGVEAFLEELKQYDIIELAQASGVPVLQIQEAANMILEGRNMIICWAMGITQHQNGVDNIREIVNLLLLRGSIGKAGAGTCPVRGHSNVQGDRTMGIWEKPKPAFLDRLQTTFQFEPPRKHGYNTVEAIKAMGEGEAKVFFAMGGNFLSATPDTEYTAKALQNCELTVHVSTKLNRSHLVHGKTALILPCLGRTEIDEQKQGKQFVSVENSMGVVHSSQGSFAPASEALLSEPAIVVQLAQATFGSDSPIDWERFIEDYDHIREAIEQVVPGFENYNQRVRQVAGFYLPNGAREGNFKTASGKAHFSVVKVPHLPLEKDEFLMMTIRSHDQFNTTIYGLDDRYRGVYNGRRVVFMNREDMQERGLKKGDFVNLLSHYEGVERVAEFFAVVPYDIPRAAVATYFPEANVLVPVDLVARKSHTPVSKSVVVKVERVRG